MGHEVFSHLLQSLPQGDLVSHFLVFLGFFGQETLSHLVQSFLQVAFLGQSVLVLSQPFLAAHADLFLGQQALSEHGALLVHVLALGQDALVGQVDFDLLHGFGASAVAFLGQHALVLQGDLSVQVSFFGHASLEVQEDFVEQVGFSAVLAALSVEQLLVLEHPGLAIAGIAKIKVRKVMSSDFLSKLVVMIFSILGVRNIYKYNSRYGQKVKIVREIAKFC